MHHILLAASFEAAMVNYCPIRRIGMTPGLQSMKIGLSLQLGHREIPA
jgi:hypothetical protein